MNTPGKVLTFILFSIASACADEGSRWTGTVSDSAGVTIVSNSNAGLWAPGEELVLEEELRIGTAEGDPLYQFGDVQGIGVDSHDRIFVFDGLAQHIQVYTPDGVHQQTIGRRGEGPGEFRAGAGPLIGPGDTILVYDRSGRFVRFAPDGLTAGGVRANPQEGVPVSFKATGSGLLAERIRLRVGGAPTGEDAIILLRTDGSVTDTLRIFPSEQLPNRAFYQLFAPRQPWDVTSDTVLLVGARDEYRIASYSGRELTRIVRKTVEGRTVTDEDKEAVNNALRAFLSTPETPPEMIEQAIRRYDYSGPLPVFEALFAGPKNTIWVQHFQAPSDFVEGGFGAFDPRRHFGAPAWDVFDADGRFLGVVTMPRGFHPRAFQGSKIYGVWYNEYDVSFVVRLGIVGDIS
ncbi:MAG: 6-bladed beta-propeller [Gemmatimonadota bacterium]